MTNIFGLTEKNFKNTHINYSHDKYEKKLQFKNLNWWLVIVLINLYYFNNICNAVFLSVSVASVVSPRREHTRAFSNELFSEYHIDHDMNNRYSKFYRPFVNKKHPMSFHQKSQHIHQNKHRRRQVKHQNEYVIQQEKPVFIEKCHIIPRKDQLIFTNFYENQPLSRKTNSRVARQLPVNNYDNKHQHKRRSDENFIIHPHYHESFFNLPKDVLKLYKNELIPKAIEYWQSSLKLKYPYFPIYLGRLCATSQIYYSETTKSVSCEQSCSSETKCGDYIVIPEEHLDVCRYCLNGNDCREKGTKNQGVNADFILYISAINTEHCNISNTVAFASYCQLESKHNRPVAGYVNICPQSVSSKESDVHSALATLKHEMLHALGFSAGLYAFFY